MNLMFLLATPNILLGGNDALNVLWKVPGSSAWVRPEGQSSNINFFIHKPG